MQKESELWNGLSYGGLPYFSRLAAKLSGMITKFQGRSLKIQHRSSFDLNGLNNGTQNYFKHSLKSMQFFQRLMGAMNCR